MSSAAMLRPGVALGQYPQREDFREGMLDRLAGATVGRIRPVIQGLRGGRASFVKIVNGYAEELMSLNEQELRSRVYTMRRRLYGEGLTEELVALSFAIIRETATRKLDMRHYDVQISGGHVMLKGMIAEMETGEGKTLTATLPAATAALAGIPVHVVTVNDFLVTRDAQWMEPIYRSLGLTVGTITENSTQEERRKAYSCDVTYCTNKQLVFDYLKDRLLLGSENRRLHLQIEGLYREKPRTSRLLLRGLCFAIVDEADSVLVDEARTPLVISNKGESLQEATTYTQAIGLARELDTPRDFTISGQDKLIELTDFGKTQVARQAKSLGGIWTGVRRREELVCKALAALHLYKANQQYLLKDGKIRIIDEYTGRVMEDRSWERGLHQMIEAKEGIELSGRQETLARISYQRFFRRYLRLGGMTGTAREISKELWAVYRLDVVPIPTNRPLQRTKTPDRVYVTSEQKWQAVISRVKELHKQGRPVLLGTRSVAASEILSRQLTTNAMLHQVLNARQNEKEAKIVTQAGHRGRITVATNMAGRGTDIKLAPDVEELGGLHVIATERHDAHRIDRQLFGRCGRQGDRGSYESILCLEDDLISGFWGRLIHWYIQRHSERSRVLPSWISAPLVRVAQLAAEKHNSRTRRDLLRLDDNLSDILAFTGRPE